MPASFTMELLPEIHEELEEEIENLPKNGKIKVELTHCSECGTEVTSEAFEGKFGGIKNPKIVKKRFRKVLTGEYICPSCLTSDWNTSTTERRLVEAVRTSKGVERSMETSNKISSE